MKDIEDLAKTLQENYTKLEEKFEDSSKRLETIESMVHLLIKIPNLAEPEQNRRVVGPQRNPLCHSNSIELSQNRVDVVENPGMILLCTFSF